MSSANTYAILLIAEAEGTRNKRMNERIHCKAAARTLRSNSQFSPQLKLLINQYLRHPRMIYWPFDFVSATVECYNGIFTYLSIQYVVLLMFKFSQLHDE